MFLNHKVINHQEKAQIFQVEDLFKNPQIPMLNDFSNPNIQKVEKIQC